MSEPVEDAVSDARFRALLESAPVGHCDIASDGRIVSVNSALLAMVGRAREEVVGRAASSLLHPDCSTENGAVFGSDSEPATPAERRLVLCHRDGSPVHTLWLTAPVPGPGAKGNRITSLVVDVTAQELAQEELARARREAQTRSDFLDALLDSVDVGIVACDADGHLTQFNPTTRRWHGLGPDAALEPEQFAEAFDLFDEDGVTPLATERIPLVRALREGHVSDAEIVIAPRGRPATRVIVQGRALAAQDGTPLGAVIAMQDITAQRALHADLQHRAFHDQLTGLPNRALFLDRLDMALAQRITGLDRGAAVLLLDIDNFKAVNDTRGHESGDLLLVEVAMVLRTCCRLGDTVARLGGDEFAIVLPDADLAEALRVTERILTALRTPVAAGGMETIVSVSVGVVVASGQDRSTLVRQADLAMYAAKERGGDGFAVFEAELYEAMLARFQLELELRGAAARGELVLEYQPVLDLAQHRMVGVEALLRWDHPEHGRIAPLTFIPLAEDGGSIRTIGDWVLEAACRQVLAWDAVFPRTPLDMAVNLSPRQLTDADLVARTAEILHRSGIEPQRIVLEVTESCLAGDTTQMIAKLDQLKGLGVRIAIDDFGTGFSSLSFLRRLPIDIVKVDKSFVAGIAREPEEWALTTAIIKLAESLGKQTLAEGIELGEQLAHLRALRCDLGQGFLFDRPLTPEQVTERLAASQPPPSPV